MKISNWLTAIIVLVIVAITAGVALAGQSGEEIDLTNVLINGKDVTTLEQNNVTVKPLQEIEVSFKVKNKLDEKVTKITAKIIDANNQDDGYQFTLTGKEEFHLDAGKETSVKTIKTAVPANVPTGTYSLQLTAEGYTLDDTPVSDKQEFKFNVKREKAEVVLALEALAAGKETLTCSETVTLKSTVTNTGSVTEDDVLVRVVEGSTELYNSSKAGLDLTLAPGESKTVSMPVTVSVMGKHTLTTEAGFNYINNQPGSTAVPKTVEITKKTCLSEESTPKEAELTLLDGAKVDFVVKLNEDGFNGDITWSLDGVAVAKGKTFSNTFSKAGTFTVKAALNQESRSWKVVVADKPLDLAAFGLTQSEIDLITADPSNVNNLVLTKVDGKVAFSQAVDLSNTLYLGDVVKIGKQFVAVDSVKAPGLNKPATITLKNIAAGKVTTYKFDGFGDAGSVDKAQVCTAPACTVVKHENSEYIFTVQGFSTYIAITQKEAELVAPAEIVIEDSKTNSTISTAFTVQNTGTIGSIKNIVFETTGIGSSYLPKVTGAPSELAPQESRQVTLELTSNKDADSGKKQVGTLKINASTGVKIIPVYVNTKSFLTIDSVQVNDKTSGEWSLDSINTIEATVKNTYDVDMEEVTVIAKILDVNNDDLEEETDEFVLNKNGDDDKVKFEFDLRNEDVDKKEYTLQITAVGKAKDGTRHETTVNKVVNVDLEEHQVVISRALLATDTLACGQTYTNVEVTVKNVGKNNENDVEIRVKNSALALDLQKRDIELDKFGNSNSDYEATFSVNAEKAAAGAYPLTIEVYREGKLQESTTLTLNVKGCATTGTTVLGNNGGAVDQDLLAKQLEEQLKAKLQGTTAPVVKASLRDSNMYTLMLGMLTILIFVALVLAMALIWKKNK